MVEWPDREDPGKVPEWYVNCFRAALLRMAVVLNVTRREKDKKYPLNLGLLKLSNKKLFEKLDGSGLARALISLNSIKHDPNLSLDSEFLAENFFYARINFSEEDSTVKGRKRAFQRTRVTYQVPETFIEWSYKRLEPPQATDTDLGRDKYDDEEFIFECATNYLLKNFWHNFVHRQLQGINEGNYHDFGGSARYDSDFEADNLATIFLIKSYRLPVHTKGSSQDNDAIRAVWQRNRCNFVFQERASHRHQETQSMKQLERYQEAEWRFFRTICNRLSIELIAKGMAVRSLRVFANGQVKKGRVGYFRSGPGKVIVELNSRRYYTKCPVYVPPEYYGAKRDSQERLANIRKFQDNRVDEIVTIAAVHYRNDLQSDEKLRSDAEGAMKALYNRLALPNRLTGSRGRHANAS